jgi:hypothetical protein
MADSRSPSDQGSTGRRQRDVEIAVDATEWRLGKLCVIAVRIERRALCRGAPPRGTTRSIVQRATRRSWRLEMVVPDIVHAGPAVSFRWLSRC